MKKIFCLSALLLLIGSLSADDDKDYVLRKKIQETSEKIEEYKSRQKESDEKLAELRAGHEKRMKKRKADIAKLSSDITGLEIELKNKKIEKAVNERAVKNYDFQFAQFKNKLKENMASYSAIIAGGIPYSLDERAQNLRSLITDTEFENISAEEILNRYYNFLNKETALGMDSEVFVKDNMKYLRIGRLIMAYSDDKGEETGILTIKNGKWAWDSDLTFTMRKTIRDSIKMVEGKRAPDVTLFPVALPVLRENMRGAVK